MVTGAGTTSATLSALVVAVPEAEPAVGRWRSRYDRSAGWGVPAHVTVLYPFVSPEHLDERVLLAAAEAASTVVAFDVRFERIEWFGEDVVYLAPEPAASFVALTQALCARFPEHPPYEGEYDGTVPHLTVGHDAPAEQLAAAADAVRTHLPVTGRVESVRLIQGSRAPSSWCTVAELPLGHPGGD